ncbi:uncharacterized protein si:dkey-246e1.3 [Oreochromis aureus]|uniref:uncharacterized protein si:dkey-246e1.3 n=1 Tax=Oreochromis aureus TaxID=47969 RepID=UPI001953FB13|nr:uncharacterized protein si:dkey-246e1.3 [Oreochromis aureus]
MSESAQDIVQTAVSLHLNGTAALEQQDENMDSDLFDIKVFNVVMITLAFCILAITGLYCIAVCHNRSRQSKRAQLYESAVTRGEPQNPVAVKAVKRSTSFINPLTFFRKPEAPKDNSRIYYIYSNPLPVGGKDEDEEGASKPSGVPEAQQVLSLSHSFQEFASDPKSGVVLDPPIFYMQL